MENKSIINTSGKISEILKSFYNSKSVAEWYLTQNVRSELSSVSSLALVKQLFLSKNMFVL